MIEPSRSDAPLAALVQAIRARSAPLALQLLTPSPELAKACFARGATREAPMPYYAGDTALHVAAAVYEIEIVRALIAMDADIRARNRRGAEPLHYAAVGLPGSDTWNPCAQAATIALLIEAGADANAADKSGVTPLHRAVRTRCAAAVKALLEGGADVGARNNNGSTPLLLATHNTGRGGTGSPEAKAQQLEILRLLELHGASGVAGLA
jgi:Ankyrin repeats (many copies)/Ankyrin repeat